jgi:hypothetical protein
MFDIDYTAPEDGRSGTCDIIQLVKEFLGVSQAPLNRVHERFEGVDKPSKLVLYRIMRNSA